MRTPLPRSWEAIRNVSRRRSEVAKLRKVVRNGELIRNQEHKARLMFDEAFTRDMASVGGVFIPVLRHPELVKKYRKDE